MIRPVKGQTVTGVSPEAQQNEQINDWLRSRGNRSIVPRNLADNEVIRQMFDQGDDQEPQQGGD